MLNLPAGRQVDNAKIKTLKNISDRPEVFLVLSFDV